MNEGSKTAAKKEKEAPHKHHKKPQSGRRMGPGVLAMMVVTERQL
jgi:hypothetical protein